MKVGQLKFERKDNGQVKVAKHWGDTHDEEWQAYISREDWLKVTSHLAEAVAAPEPKLDEALKDVEESKSKKKAK